MLERVELMGKTQGKLLYSNSQFPEYGVGKNAGYIIFKYKKIVI